MDDRATRFRHLALRLCFSGVVVFGVLGLAELAVRGLTDVNFLDSSRGGFVAQRFGNSYGNTPNFEGVSYGVAFATDAEGFRIDPGFTPTTTRDSPAVLMLGDSVLFGSGVTDDRTIAGHLRQTQPDVTIYNAAAVGYDTFDYLNVAESLLPAKADVRTVYVVYCLNDLIAVSSQAVKQSLNPSPDSPPPPHQSLLRLANDYLRSRSKMYLVLKSLLRDTQMIYFEHDLAQYQDEDTVISGLQPLVDLKRLLDDRGVRLKVFVSPYEAQLRPGRPDAHLRPQARLASFFAERGIDAYDMTPDFEAASPANSRALFLYGDPMHLNARGHEVVAGVIERDIRANRRGDTIGR